MFKSSADKIGESLQLGVASRVITPPVGTCLAGYEPDLHSESVNDDLTATAFAFKQGNTVALMLSATLCAMSSEISNLLLTKIEESYNIPRTHCLIHSTHTHSGPNLFGGTGWGDIDKEYLNGILLPAIYDAIGEALDNTTAVKMGVASGMSYVGINRRELTIENKIDFGQNPWGPFNPEMTVISFKDNNGKTVASMVHYGCHGTAAGMNREITRDWPGVMVDVLSEISGAPAAFFNGSEGDTGPRLTNGETVGLGKIHYAMELGGVAAQDAVRIFRNIRGYHDVKLDIVSDTIELPLEKLMDYETAKKLYEPIKNETVNIKGKQAAYYRNIIKLHEDGYINQETRKIDQNIIRIGDVAFVGTPFELFSEIEMRIAQESNVPRTLLLSLTNGCEGYFVTEDQICRGGYEVESFRTSYKQPYVNNADWHMITKTLEDLKKLDNSEK